MTFERKSYQSLILLFFEMQENTTINLKYLMNLKHRFNTSLNNLKHMRFFVSLVPVVKSCSNFHLLNDIAAFIMKCDYC